MLAAGNSVKGKAFSIPIVRGTICIFPYDAKSLADTCYYNMHYPRLFVSSRITVKNLLLVDLCFESQALEGAPTTSEKKKGVDKKIFSQIV